MAAFAVVHAAEAGVGEVYADLPGLQLICWEFHIKGGID
jgi:hypothetical protein